MKAAQYPQKKCREAVFGELNQGHTCELPLMHPGPCASLSAKSSVENRDRWEERNPGWEDNIGNMDIVI